MGILPNIIMQSFENFSTINILFETIISWWTAPQLCQMLNDLVCVDDEITKLKDGAQNDSIKISKFLSNLLKIYVLCTSIVFGTLRIGWELDFGYPVHCIFLVIYGYTSKVFEVVNEAKAILFFKNLELFFKQVEWIFERHNG